MKREEILEIAAKKPAMDEREARIYIRSFRVGFAVMLLVFVALGVLRLVRHEPVGDLLTLVFSYQAATEWYQFACRHTAASLIWAIVATAATGAFAALYLFGMM